MSASMLQPIIDGVVKNYNADVFLWSDDLKEHFEVYLKCYRIHIKEFYLIAKISHGFDAYPPSGV